MLEAVYFSSIVPSATYCVTIWGTCSLTLLQDLERIHTRAAKIIHNLPDRVTDTEILEKTHWQPFSNSIVRDSTVFIIIFLDS